MLDVSLAELCSLISLLFAMIVVVALPVVYNQYLAGALWMHILPDLLCRAIAVHGITIFHIDSVLTN